MFAIRFTPEAIEDLRRYDKRERKRIMDDIDSCLKHEPGRERRNNKELRPNRLAEEEFILAELDDFNREIELARQSRALMKFLEARAPQTETISFREARTLLGLTE